MWIVPWNSLICEMALYKNTELKLIEVILLLCMVNNCDKKRRHFLQPFFQDYFLLSKTKAKMSFFPTAAGGEVLLYIQQFSTTERKEQINRPFYISFQITSRLKHWLWAHPLLYFKVSPAVTFQIPRGHRSWCTLQLLSAFIRAPHCK